MYFLLDVFERGRGNGERNEKVIVGKEKRERGRKGGKGEVGKRV